MPASSDSPPETLARAFRPSALIRGSVALHAVAAGALIMRPQLWPWALTAVVADRVSLDVQTQADGTPEAIVADQKNNQVTVQAPTGSGSLAWRS